MVRSTNTSMRRCRFPPASPAGRECPGVAPIGAVSPISAIPRAPGSGKRGTRTPTLQQFSAAGRSRSGGTRHLAAADPAPAGQRGRDAARCEDRRPMAATNKCLARSNKPQTRLTSSLTFCTFGHPRCVQYRRPRRQPNAWPHPAVGAAALNPPPPHPQTPPARHPAPHQHPAPPPDREADNSPHAIPGLSRPSGVAPSALSKK
jgi:hypothetical protein